MKNRIIATTALSVALVGCCQQSEVRKDGSVLCAGKNDGSKCSPLAGPTEEFLFNDTDKPMHITVIPHAGLYIQYYRPADMVGHDHSMPQLESLK